eukprot:1132203-Rhodomonas_salina.2
MGGAEQGRAPAAAAAVRVPLRRAPQPPRPLRHDFQHRLRLRPRHSRLRLPQPGRLAVPHEGRLHPAVDQRAAARGGCAGRVVPRPARPRPSHGPGAPHARRRAVPQSAAHEPLEGVLVQPWSAARLRLQGPCQARDIFVVVRCCARHG